MRRSPSACPRCGASCDSSMRFCGACGLSLGPSSEAPARASSRPRPFAGTMLGLPRAELAPPPSPAATPAPVSSARPSNRPFAGTMLGMPVAGSAALAALPEPSVPRPTPPPPMPRLAAAEARYQGLGTLDVPPGVAPARPRQTVPKLAAAGSRFHGQGTLDVPVDAGNASNAPPAELPAPTYAPVVPLPRPAFAAAPPPHTRRQRPLSRVAPRPSGRVAVAAFLAGMVFTVLVLLAIAAGVFVARHAGPRFGSASPTAPHAPTT